MTVSEPDDPSQNLDTNEISDGVWWALDTVCDTATLLILEALWMGEASFTGLVKATGLQKALISKRLSFFQEEGLIKKEIPATGGKRSQYFLDAKGLALFPVAVLMLQWEQKWAARKPAMNFEVTHKSCGEKLVAEMRCRACEQRVHVTDLEISDHEKFVAGETKFIPRRKQAGLNRQNTLIFHEIAEILGDRWTTLIIRQAFLGTRRFDGFLAGLGIATNILTDRLENAVSNGLLERKPYQTNPIRYDYAPSRKAVALLPAILMIGDWGIEMKTPEKGKNLHILHSCGAPLKPYVVCQHCGEEVRQQETALERL